MVWSRLLVLQGGVDLRPANWTIFGLSFRYRIPSTGRSGDDESLEVFGRQQHETVPNCGSYEVQFPDGRPSRYFYFEDLPGRRLRAEQLTREQALEQARMFARVEQDKLDAGNN